jgi:putative ABC transport system permease protein
MNNLWQDIKYGIRILGRKPGFTITAVITLALGIGVNSAIFSAINAILLRPLPYKEPERLVQIWERNLKSESLTNSVSPLNFLDWQKQSQSFEEMAGYNIWLPTLMDDSRPEEIPGSTVTANFFDTLGVAPALGRGFLPEEEQRGKNRVVIISHGLWQRRFGGDPEILGKALSLGGRDFTVIGVMPSNYRHPEPFMQEKAELWTPLVLNRDEGSRGFHYIRVIGRLKPEATLQQARTEMESIAGQLEQAYPQNNKDWTVTLRSLHDQVTGNISVALWILQAAVGFVLLVACVNLANLFLVRANAREREIAIRSALGAARSRLIRQLLTESVLLAIAGGAIGLLLAAWGVDILVSLSPADIPRIEEIGFDSRVLTFTGLASFATTLIFGLVPAIQVSRVRLTDSLKEGSQNSTSGLRSRRLSGSLVIAEVAVSLILLVGAGLMLKSFLHLQKVDVGFNPENLLTMQLSLPAKYREDHKLIGLYQKIIERVESLPGVESAGITLGLPFSGINDLGINVEIEGRPEPEPGKSPATQYRVVSSNYFRAAGMKLLDGRLLSDQDNENSPEVTVINETFARTHWPDEDAIGKRLTMESFGKRATRTIVGVVADVHHEGLNVTPLSEMYVPYQQNPWAFSALVLRTASDQTGIVSSVQNAVWENEREITISKIGTMEHMISNSIAHPRFNALLLGLFSTLALLLAAVGIYGVMSYILSQCTREIGIRIALGAQRQDILKLVLGQGLVLALVGVFIGLIGAFALTRFLESLLFEVSATDPVTYIAIATLLTLVALAACYIPARRAMKVDPIEALRYE